MGNMNVTVIDQNNVNIAVTPTPTQTINIDRGLLGPSGWSGYSGTSGFSGNSTSGYSGYSGAVGQSGYSGFSGQQGTSINVKGEVPTVEDLPPTGNQVNDAYIVTEDGNLWVWNGSAWYDAGQIVGPQGLSGYSGYSGDSTSGYSGYSGETVSGYSGYSGIGESGYSGFSGETVSGYSGYSGDSTSGFSGYSGETVSGYSGYSGESISGFSGYSGSGISGYSGSGISGFSGYSGETISGYSGYSGSGVSGFSGYSGSGVSGYSGYSGSGLSGFSGSGVSGFSGFSGSGVSGYSGYSGIATSGYSGYSGIGTSGYSGYSGAVGAGGTIGNWGSFWDTTTQTTTINTPTPITFNSYDLDNTGVSIGSPTSRIVFANSGTYSLTFSIQFTNTSTANGATQIWLKKNGTNIPDTNSHFDVPDKQGSAFSSEILTVNFVFNVTANDYVQLYWDTTNASVSLETIAGNGTYPRTPSVIFTATQVMYGQSGYSGISGYSGNSTSGYSGFSGYSGSGISGYSGSGISGYSGSGISGYSGSGVSGFSGYSGSGLSGFSGYSGSGISGYSGSGVSGFSGFSGSGISGYSGIGTSGYSGYSGITPTIGGSNTQVQFNNSGVLGGSANLVFNGTDLNLTSSAGAVRYTATGATAMALYADNNAGYIGTENNFPLVFQTNNAGRMWLNATGLGIGTSIPYGLLNIKGTNGQLVLANGNTSGGVKITATDVNYTANGYLAFEGYANEYARFLSTGNLAIGVTTATERLHISNATASTNAIAQFTNGTTGTAVANGLYFGIDSTNEATMFNFYNSAIKFGTNSTERMRITGAGLVGIGTSSPARILELKASQSCMVFNDNTNQWTIGTGSFIDGSNSFNFYLGGVGSYLRINSSGNLGLGLGLVPSAWLASSKAMQIGDYASLWWDGYTGATAIGNNVYQSGNTTDNYIVSGVAPTRYRLAGGAHSWFIAPSGTAGNAISFTQAMTLDASGNLGVGTTSPVQKLQVNGATGNPATSGSTQNGLIRLSNTTDNGVLDIGLRSGGNGAWLQSTDGGAGGMANQYALLLNPVGGNVGIGTSSPAVTLHVSASVSNTGGTGVAILRVANTRVNTGSSGAAISFVTNEISGSTQYTRAQITGEYDGSSNINGRLLFATTNISGDLQERMRITSAGAVTIGDTASYARFGVRGFTGTSGSYNLVAHFGDGVSGNSGYIVQGGSGSNTIGLLADSGNLILGTGLTEKARIDSSGNLLVGTTTQNSSVTNTKTIVGGIVNSFRGEVNSLATNTNYTMFTLTADYATYIVTVSGLASNVIYSETAIVMLNNTSVSVSIIADGALVTISNSGLNVQVAQLSGGTMGNLLWSAIRIL